MPYGTRFARAWLLFFISFFSFLFMHASNEKDIHIFLSFACFKLLEDFCLYFVDFFDSKCVLLVSEMLYGFLHRGIWVLFNMVMCILASYAESSTNFVGKGYTSSVGDIYNSYVCGVDPGGAICVWFVSCPVLIPLLIVRFLLPYSIKVCF
jgi:hypothetical protein